MAKKLIRQTKDDGWVITSLHAAGIDEGKIAEVIQRIHERTYQNIHSILIVKDGKLAFEQYFDGYAWDYNRDQFRGAFTHYGIHTLHNLASVAKSFTSALVGITIDQGFIPGVQEKLFSFFPEYAGLMENGKDQISLHHLLTMTAGSAWNEMDLPYDQPENDLIRLFHVPDPLGYILSKPMAHEPGAQWYYNSGATNLLGEIIRRASGLRMDDFAAKYLFAPLGITSCKWEYITPNIVLASGNLKLCPRDMAKLGCLFLNGGVWKGKRIVSEKWVEESTKWCVSLSDEDGYGYQWWLTKYPAVSPPLESFCASGWGGQKITVFPGLDLVVVMTAGNYVGEDPADEIIAQYILPAVYPGFTSHQAASCQSQVSS